MDLAEGRSLSTPHACSHEEVLAEYEFIVDNLTDRKNEILNEIEQLRDMIQKYQDFYEEFGASNQSHPVTELAENSFDAKYELYDSLSAQLCKTNQELEKYQKEISFVTEEALSSNCECTQLKCLD